jgi:hypothetical protein
MQPIIDCGSGRSPYHHLQPGIDMADEANLSTEQTWIGVLERFADFQSKPCLRASGPDHDRPSSKEVLRELQRQFVAVEPFLPPSPGKVAQEHVAAILAKRGIGTRAAGKRPEHRSLWEGIFRAIVFARDDYRCFFCGRSAEAGLGYRGHFLWEAFVSAKSKRGSHVDDAKAAVAAFVDALPNPRTCVQCSEGAYSLIGAALLRTGWASDISLLSQPCIVVRAEPHAV